MFRTGCGLTLIAGLLAFGSVKAGVYNNKDRSPFPVPTKLSPVRLHLSDLRGIGLPKSGDEPGMREDYLRQRDDLEAKQKKDGSLGTTDAIDLSACYIRTGKPLEAIKLLEEVLKNIPEKDPNRFKVLANLATAYSSDPVLLDRAVQTQREVLDAWPAEVEGWSAEQWKFNARAEWAFLQLLRSRQREIQANGGREPPVKTVDPLFGPVKFTGPSGKYEPGKLSGKAAAELPPDAASLVAQLLFWLPNDGRLFWLYGELLNADGQVNDAFTVLNEVFEARNWSNVAELRDHRRALDTARTKEQPTAEPTDTTPPTGPTLDDYVPGWRQAAAGFGVGILVTILLAWQWREWFRRR